MAARDRIVLLAHQGKTNVAITDQLGLSRPTMKALKQRRGDGKPFFQRRGRSSLSQEQERKEAFSEAEAALAGALEPAPNYGGE